MTYQSSPIGFPQDLEELVRYLEEEVDLIEQAINRPSITRLNLQELNAEPERPRDGDLVYADGTNWNPGSGEGGYLRENGSWVKL